MRRSITIILAFVFGVICGGVIANLVSRLELTGLVKWNATKGEISNVDTGSSASESEEGQPKATSQGRSSKVDGWALLMPADERYGWTNAYAQPDSSSERITQPLIGELLKVVRCARAWCLVQDSAMKSWKAWVATNDLKFITNGCRAEIVREDKIVVVKAPGVKLKKGLVLPFGTILPRVGHIMDAGRLPDGHIVRFAASEVRILGSVQLADALMYAKGFLHFPYQRGANSPEAMDACGLVQLVFRLISVDLPRDIDALLQAGRPIVNEALAIGDVVFFDAFDGKPHPVLLLDTGISFLEAHPASGINVGLMKQMRNRGRIIRRYIG